MVVLIAKIAKTALVLGFIAFLILGFFGVQHLSVTMGPDGDMTMSPCLFMTSKTVVCNMTPLQHIAAWQSMFTTMSQQDGLALILLLLAMFALVLIRTKARWPKPRRTLVPIFCVARRENYLPPTLLQELFSNGILNRKVF
ncbi:hypothetical protein K2P56_02090 [Patescibacteria group bacterium]|nr:hypothetical protein [Patescibacteria group bacterium]